jgi:mannan endo-1,4-beta-mannosidase
MKALLFLFCIVSTNLVFSQTQVTYTINTQTDLSPISPFIFGSCNGGYDQATIRRQGGNRMTGYNWENNASNAGADYFHQSDDYLCWISGFTTSQCNEPAKFTRFFHETALANNAQSAITIPMAGFVAKDKNGTTVSTAEAAPSNRWNAIVNVKGSSFTLNPNQSDNVVYTDEYLNYLISTYGNSNSSTGIKNYILDNEPGIWNGTHPRIFSGVNNIANFMSKSIALAQTIKNMDVNAKVFGPECYGFNEYFNFQDAVDWNSFSGAYSTFLSKYLNDMKNQSLIDGHRLLDVLSVHWYPQNDQYPIFSSVTNTETIEARMQNPRMLWDSTFTTNSWIYQYFPSYLPIIPYLKTQINQYYPGTKFGITEYDYGADDNFSGGIAEAEALMAFIKTNTEYATKWNQFSGFSLKAIELFRQVPFPFASTSVTANSTNLDKSTVVASINGTSDEELHIIVTNKDLTTAIEANFAITKNTSTTYNNILVYTISSDAAVINTQILSPTIFTSNGFNYNLEPGTIYHFVLKTGSLITNENDLVDEILLYPNPTINELNISTKIDATVFIMNAIGQKIDNFEIKANSTKTISTLNLPSGIYFINFNCDGKTLVKKLLKE